MDKSPTIVAIVGDALISQLYTEILFPSMHEETKSPCDFDPDFNLANCCVQWFPWPAMRISDVPSSFEDIINCRAEIVILHVGGNDLKVGDTKALDLATELMNIAYETAALKWESGCVRHVVLCQIRSRFKPVRRWEDFNSATLEVFEHVKKMTDGNPNISYEVQRQFPKGNALDKERPEDILQDGIHFGLQGLHRLYRSLQSSIVQSVKRI